MYLRLWPTRYVLDLSRQSCRMEGSAIPFDSGGVQMSITVFSPPHTARWDLEQLGWRLFRILQFHPLCQERGCRQRAILCWHWLCAERIYYCPDHAEQHGFCVNCGQCTWRYESSEDPRICRDCQYEEYVV